MSKNERQTLLWNTVKQIALDESSFNLIDVSHMIFQGFFNSKERRHNI